MAQNQVMTGKLLLVDDDEAFLRVLDKALSRRGYDVLSADSLESARLILQSQRPAYAVVDLKLDGDSGLDLIPELVTINEDMIIVVLTGYASIATAVSAIKLGATNYLAKPVMVDEVVRALAGKDQPALTKEDFTPMSVERLEWEHIQKVLQENDGNITATARSLGMYRRTLQRKLAKKPVSQ
jgi:two-component system response regulator RegA